MLNNIAVGIIISLLFVFIIIIFCILLIKIYINKIKEHNQHELDFQKNLNQSVIETQEQVFENISQDLHDDIGQQLTFINFEIEKLKLDSVIDKKKFDNLSAANMKVAQSVRDMSHSLNNHLLHQNNLIEAVSLEIERIKNYKKIKITSQLDKKNNETLSKNEKIVLFRIFQESISNILKYAKASEVEIIINLQPHFFMKIKDNGIGFEMNNATQNTIGLKNMKNRAKMINFDLKISSIIKEGTSVIISKSNE